MIHPVISNIIDRPIPTFLSVSDARLQVNLFGDTSQDDYLQLLCSLAQELVEDYIGQYLQPTRTEAFYQRFDTSGMTVPQPYISNYKLEYWDENDVLQTVSSSTYFIDTTMNPILIKPVLNATFPAQTSSTRTNAIKFTYDSILYGAENDMDIERIHQTMLLMLTHWYNNRSDTETSPKKEIAYGFLRLLNKYRLPTL